MKSFERLVLSHLSDITGPMLDPLQYTYRADRSVDEAVDIGLQYMLHHLDYPGTYARTLFVDFSSVSTPSSLKSYIRSSPSWQCLTPPASGSSAS